MRKAIVLYKDEEAGVLVQHDNGTYAFSYNDNWKSDSSKPSISLTLPKTVAEHRSEFLFPFFFNMLPEGANKNAICRQRRIDQYDYFGLLVAVAATDSIGAVRIVKYELI